MISFWEKHSLLQYDCIVIGNGMTGLSVAASIKEKYPNSKVLILEKGLLPTGASTKNAGFACFGSPTEILADIQHMGEQSALQLIEKRKKGLERLKMRLGEKKINARYHGGFELLNKEKQLNKDQIDYLNELLMPVFKDRVFRQYDHLIREFGFNQDYIQQLIYNPFEYQIDTGKMVKSLMEYVQMKKVKIITGAEVKHWEEDDSGAFKVHVEGGIHEKLVFQTEKIALCTNAFSRHFFPEWDINPGRGHVLVTAPIPALKFKGAFHFDEGFYYFRNYKKRIIFGGGRNLDFATENTTSFDKNPQIVKDLKHKLQHIILNNKITPVVEDIWTGIMAFGSYDKNPIVKEIGRNTVAGVRLNGMGVAISSVLGDEIAALLYNTKSPS
ncbi:MAG: FAD-binding oxidoreductase [Cytophagales bacterium]|nr:MAG: FAD-binding oxidoreductase [Cytophagales bacterium]